MGAISKRAGARRQKGRPRSERPRADDPRVVRSRAAVFDAARQLFLSQGYAGTTMQDIAELAGLTKRTIYNNYGDKEALFRLIVADAFAFVEKFVRAVREGFASHDGGSSVQSMLEELGQRLALAIVRVEVISLRRLLIGEARSFPTLAGEYFDRAPGKVLEALAVELESLSARGLLKVDDPQRAAAQFAYLIAGEPLDRAVLVGTVPPQEHVMACAREGVRTFMARYGPRSR